MEDIFSTAQDCVVAPSYYLTRVDQIDAYAFGVGVILAAIFFGYINRRYR